MKGFLTKLWVSIYCLMTEGNKEKLQNTKASVQSFTHEAYPAHCASITYTGEISGSGNPDCKYDFVYQDKPGHEKISHDIQFTCPSTHSHLLTNVEHAKKCISPSQSPEKLHLVGDIKKACLLTSKNDEGKQSL